MKHFLTLTKLELVNLFGINLWRYGKDPADKKRRATLLAVIVVLIAIGMFYFGATAYAYVLLNASDRILMSLGLIVVAFTLFFNAFRAKSSLYREKDRELLASLPLRSLPIVLARLLRIYLEGLLVTLVILLPGIVVYFIYVGFSLSFCLTALLAILFLPVLPTALAAWIGILFAAIIARNRHKVLTEVLLMLIILVVTFALPLIITGSASSSEPTEYFSQISPSGSNYSGEVTAQLSAQVASAFESAEKSSPLFKAWDGLFRGNLSDLLLYGLASLLILLLTALVIGKNFFTISGKLIQGTSHHDYQLASLRNASLMNALVRKEAGRYFSSGIYVTNTIVGPIFAVAFAIALGFFSMEEILQTTLQLPINLNLQAALPYILGMFFCIMSISASSVSMEGNTLWQVKCLPISPRDLCNAKLLFSLLVMGPFYVLSEVILLFTVRATLMERLWLIMIPALYLVFSATFGLFINLKLPKFQWNSHAEVVKQSAACGLSMLAMFTALLPIFLICLAPAEMTNLANLLVMLLLGLATFLLYSKPDFRAITQ